jgi:hypothetical protein
MGAKYLGFRGQKLHLAMLVLVVAPSFILFGYNNGSTGGIASLASFTKVSAHAGDYNIYPYTLPLTNTSSNFPTTTRPAALRL